MIILYILAIYAFSFSIRNLSGPFNIIVKLRSTLLQNKYVGNFFYELFTCPWCIGFHCGYIVYLLHFTSFDIKQMIVWAFAGSAISGLLDSIIDKLNSK